MRKRNRKHIEKWLAQLAAGIDLNHEEAAQLFELFFKGDISEKDAKSALLLLAAKKETASELSGCVGALRKLEPPYQTSMRNIMDTCGTGGDGSSSLNISTITALVVAGAGGKVAKHGNKALTSKCGSSDLMEELGVNIHAKRSVMIKSIVMNGIGYFHAPDYHPVFARVQPLRRKLKTRTIFNLMGPLVNPFALRRQFVGTGSKSQSELFAAVLSKRRLKRAVVCHSRDGMDEISTSADTDIYVIEQDKIKASVIKPLRYGFKAVSKTKYRVPNVKKSAQITARILAGNIKKGPYYDLVLLNAACGIYVSGLVDSVDDGVAVAKASISNGRALLALEGLKECSHGD